MREGDSLMKLKTLFIFNAIVTTLFGIGCVLAPQMLVNLFGSTLNPAGALMMQYGGAWLIGIGLLAWFARNSADSEARRAIVLAYLICYSIAFIVALLAQLNNVLNALGWGTVALNLVLAAGYGYFQFSRPATT
jgi:glucan phosphoethanolaminetransferase (alkaline phosphatase superfamily)